jgi:hypothetical protein
VLVTGLNLGQLTVDAVVFVDELEHHHAALAYPLLELDDVAQHVRPAVQRRVSRLPDHFVLRERLLGPDRQEIIEFARRVLGGIGQGLHIGHDIADLVGAQRALLCRHQRRQPHRVAAVRNHQFPVVGWLPAVEQRVGQVGGRRLKRGQYRTGRISAASRAVAGSADLLVDTATVDEVDGLGQDQRRQQAGDGG